jgi:hypothetical protein
MINNGLIGVVKLSNNMFIEMHDLTHEQLEAAFYFACYVQAKHSLANETLRLIDDPLDDHDVVVKAWSIAYCRLGKKAIKKVTTPKAKKLFSKYSKIKGDFVETGIDRLWLSIEGKELNKLSSDMVAVVVPRADSFAIMKRSELTEYTIFTEQNLTELHHNLIATANV